MKKVFLIVSVVAALVLPGCKTTSVTGSGVKGKSAVVKTGKRQIVDYQGATLGKEIPEWVILLAEGQYSQSILATVMPNLEGRKVFVTTGRGDNLDFVQRWSDLVDIETEVAGNIERVAGKAVEAEMKGLASAKGNKTNPTELDRTVNMYRASLVNVRFSGLERVASYWIETQVFEKKEVVDDYYEYYAVWAMDENMFESQLKKAMESIDETSTESKELKELVGKRLKDSIAISNDESVKNEADAYIINK